MKICHRYILKWGLDRIFGVGLPENCVCVCVCVCVEVITKNLNWETFTMNSVTFKRWDRVKDEKF